MASMNLKNIDCTANIVSDNSIVPEIETVTIGALMASISSFYSEITTYTEND